MTSSHDVKGIEGMEIHGGVGDDKPLSVGKYLRVMGPSVTWDWDITREDLNFIHEDLFESIKRLQARVGRRIEVRLFAHEVIKSK